MSKSYFATTNHRRPEGLSGLALVAVIALVAGVVVFALRLGPHYIDFHTLDSIMEGLPATQVHTMGKQEIRELLRKRYKINNIRDLDLREVVTIERKKGATEIMVNYEIREPLFYNVEALLTFSETYSYQ
jgi:hypothetical protein